MDQKSGESTSYALLDLHGKDSAKDIVPELGGNTVSEIKV
jgi:hypothetical protein